MKRVNWHNSPKWLKLLVARLLRRMLTINNWENDIILYTELNKWIDTEMRPTTSNSNYWINKK
jgi:hypothetical protein